MPSNDIPQNVSRLLDNHIFSVTQLEILLLLRRHADYAWPLPDIAIELYSSNMAVHDSLLRLVEAGLIEKKGETEVYQYCADGQSDMDVQAAAQCYFEMRTRVIDCIFRKPQGGHSFTTLADAFTIKRDDKP